MTQDQTRRSVLAASVLAGAATALPATGQPALAPRPTGHEQDFAWLAGRWKVRHRRLKGRLVGSTEWEPFEGTSTCWLTLGGLGTCDDNVIELPAGTYRAMGIRAFDAKTGKWAIWWLDERYADRIEPPVFGGFANGVGTFEGDDTLNGKAIKVRFQWSRITKTSARWEQAFSSDGGKTWETNWEMDFTRLA
ncbi:DUF1579 domain-containing protein [Phenylobacterium sp.]|jgi:hypothetical protein|uniref:DUF1579 domain-containing protein n=1 Tax=Phenylobacterium sp. TaxID=1871053 RepID=UPI002F92744F